MHSQKRNTWKYVGLLINWIGSLCGNAQVEWGGEYKKIEQMTPALPINNKYHWDIQPHYSIHLNKSRLCFGWQWKRKRLRLRLRLPRVYRIDVVWIHSIKKRNKNGNKFQIHRIYLAGWCQFFFYAVNCVALQADGVHCGTR